MYAAPPKLLGFAFFLQIAAHPLKTGRGFCFMRVFLTHSSVGTTQRMACLGNETPEEAAIANIIAWGSIQNICPKINTACLHTIFSTAPVLSREH